MKNSNNNSKSMSSNGQKDQDLADILAEDSVIRNEDLDLTELVESVIEFLGNHRSVKILEKIHGQEKELIGQLIEETLDKNLEGESLEVSKKMLDSYLDNNEDQKDLQSKRMQNLFGFGKDPKDEAFERVQQHTKEILRETQKAKREKEDYIRDLIEKRQKFKEEMVKMLKEGTKNTELKDFLNSVNKLVK